MSRAQNRRLRYSIVGDRSWRPNSDPRPSAEPEPIDHGDLRFGLDLNDLNAAVSIAIRISGRVAGDPAERFDIAWCGAAEHLYSSPDRLTRRDLVNAASRALDRAMESDQACHGVARSDRGAGGHRGSAPRFAAYWAPLVSSSAEDRVVESLALVQVWPLLAAGERQALAALAAYGGDGASAAESLGMSLHTFYAAITRGRTRFKREWLGGETPPARRAKAGKALRTQQAAAARRRRRERGQIATATNSVATEGGRP